MTYAKSLIAAGQKDKVMSSLFVDDPSKPGIARDLQYVMEACLADSGDPWEEVRGQVFFVKYTMRKALIMGAALATELGYSDLVSNYTATANLLQQNIQSVHWNADKGIIMEVPQTRELDSATHLGFLYGDNNDGFLTPNSSEAQSSVSVLVSSFSSYSDFSINAKDSAAGIPGLLVGRYLNDHYNGGNTSQPGGGNPWILCTASLAEFYYRASSQHADTGFITISDTNRMFWQQVVDMSAWGRSSTAEEASMLASFLTSTGTVDATQHAALFDTLRSALVLTGDGILLRIKHHIEPLDFHCAEEINKDDGQSQGAKDLTWSYGTVIGAMNARGHATSA